MVALGLTPVPKDPVVSPALLRWLDQLYVSVITGQIGGGTVGPEGPEGPPGDVIEWLNGSGAPDVSLGEEGDYYLDNDTGDVYFKTGGVWTLVSNIEGPEGPPGADAPPGVNLQNIQIQAPGASGALTGGSVVHGPLTFAAETFPWRLHIWAQIVASVSGGYTELQFQYSLNGAAYVFYHASRGSSVGANQDSVVISSIIDVPADQTVAVRTIVGGSALTINGDGRYNRIIATPLPRGTGAQGPKGDTGAPGPSLFAAPYCQLISGASSQSIPHNVETQVTLSQNIESDGAMVATANAITIVHTGVYLLRGRVFFANTASRRVMRASIRVIGSNIIAGAEQTELAPSDATGCSVETIMLLLAGDLVTLWTFQNSGAALNCSHSELRFRNQLMVMGLFGV
jgi:hypothetical protein